ncbi:hypothetical protein [Anaeropeptidivorans aminofermentans]|uniref:hypothetical protein n=1 Tax=Anaeropeptidivorans aminofermentans TaxID=2934315 RepID=UPI002024F17D|nr:hypothetical protein [Anaeropeptidivorans aminofermentans]
MSGYNEAELKLKYINHIKLKLKASFLMLLDNAVRLCHESVPFEEELPEDLIVIRKRIVHHLKNLPDLLDLKMEERTEAIKEFKGLKEDIISIGESIYCYHSLNNIISEIFLRYHKLHLIRSEKEVKINLNNFYKDAISFVTREQHTDTAPYDIASLMRCFPLKMARNRYYDYVSKGIYALAEGSDEEYLKDIISLFKLRFFPAGFDFYGKYFPSVKNELDEYLKINFDDLSHDEVLRQADSLEENMELIEEISSYAGMLYESINYLLILTTFTTNFEYITEENLIYKDIYYTVSKNINTEDFALYEENIYHDLEEATIIVVDEIIAQEKNGFLSLRAEDLNELSEDMLELAKIQRLETEIYYEMLSDAVFSVKRSPSSPAAEESLIKDTLNSFVEYMKEMTQNLPPKIQKIIRQIFLDAIPSPFTVNEFYEYMVYAFENTDSFEERLLALDMAGTIFEETGFLKELEEEDGEHSHHHHDCGCGHDHHHHDHDCNCGHDHHDHDCNCGHDHHHHDCDCGHDHH